jgi:hypothetical protein
MNNNKASRSKLWLVAIGIRSTYLFHFTSFMKYEFHEFTK